MPVGDVERREWRDDQTDCEVSNTAGAVDSMATLPNANAELSNRGVPDHVVGRREVCASALQVRAR